MSGTCAGAGQFSGSEPGLRFGEGGGALAPHVVVGHADIASAGARAVLLLREALRRWAGAEGTVSRAGAVWAVPEDDRSGADGATAECARAWESVDSEQQATPAAPLQVDTFHGADGRAAVSLVCINAQVPAGSTNAVVLDLVRKLVADKVSSVSVVAGARFNPATQADAGKAHLLRLRQGKIAGQTTGSTPFACWEPASELNDSMLAGLVQLLSLEHDVDVDCVIAAGYRLPMEICLNLPSQAPDPTTQSVKVLYEGLQHSNTAASIQAVGGGRLLPDLDDACLKKLRPACTLTVGEFAPIQPDSAASLYK